MLHAHDEIVTNDGFNLSTLNVKVKANSEENLKISGTLFYVESANIAFKIETDSGSRADLVQGRRIKLARMTKNLRVINNTTGALEARLLYGWGDVNDGLVVGDVRIQGGKNILPMPTFNLADKQLFTFPANLARQKFTLYANKNNTGTAWIGGTQNAGLPLTAGHAHEIDQYTGEIKLLGDGAGVQKIHVIEVNY